MSKDAEAKAKEMKKLHQQIRERMKKVNDMYKARANKGRKSVEFKPGD